MNTKLGKKPTKRQRIRLAKGHLQHAETQLMFSGILGRDVDHVFDLCIAEARRQISIASACLRQASK